MCIRYFWEYENDDPETMQILSAHPPGEPGDAFPASITPIIILIDGVRKVVPSFFGLTPAWAKDEFYGQKYAYNSRSETVMEKPTFRDAFRLRRCLVKVVSFHENLGRNRWLKVTNIDPTKSLYIAGLFELPNRHVKTRSHCLITTVPNALIAEDHDRMPVILSEEGQRIWLDPSTKPIDALGLLVPCPDDWLITEEITESRRRNFDGRQNLFDGN